MIRVVASDLDGTLLGSDHKTAPETIAAIQEMCDAGISFVVATSRNYPGIPEELKSTGLVSGFILNGGAQIRCSDGTVIERIPLGKKQSMDICRQLERFTAKVIISTEETDYDISEISDLEKVIKDVPVYKIYIQSEDTDVIYQIRKKLQIAKGITVTSSFRNNLEITDVKAGKGPALQKYLMSLGYKMEEIMVIGDSFNDYSMLSMDFGITVAMGNSVPEIKRIAKYVTKRNDDYGVAYAVREVLKKQKEKRGE